MRRRASWMALLSAVAAGGAGLAADRIRPIGSEVVVVENEPTGFGASQVVAGDDAGNFVVAWSTGGARIDAADAVTPLPELIPDQRIATIATQPAGTFVVAAVARTEYTVDGETTFSGRLFDPNGAPLGSEFLVHDFAGEGQFNGYYASPAAGMDDLGNFVVVWNGYDAGDSQGIFARRFDATGTPLSDAFQVNTHVTGYQYNPVVAVGPDGHFVVAWEGDHPAGASGISARAFDADGAPLGADSVVSTSTPQYEFSPRIGADASGNFVVAWNAIYQHDYPEPSEHVALARRLASDGTPASDATRLDTTPVERGFELAVDSGGGFLVAWNDDDRVMARAFDPSGAPRSRTIQVNTSTAVYVSDPVVASSGAGEFVVTWQDWGGYASQTNHRFLRRLGPPRVTTKLRVKDDPDPTKRKILIAPQSRIASSSFGRRIDPVADGAFLQVYKASGTGESACIPLPAAGWTAKGPDPATAARFAYADPEYTQGPCASLTMSNRKVVKATCKAKVHPISFGLDEPEQGRVVVRLVSGTHAYCSVFEEQEPIDKPGVFAATNTLPAGACPAPPVPCP